MPRHGCQRLTTHPGRTVRPGLHHSRTHTPGLTSRDPNHRCRRSRSQPLRPSSPSEVSRPSHPVKRPGTAGRQGRVPGRWPAGLDGPGRRRFGRPGGRHRDGTGHNVGALRAAGGRNLLATGAVVDFDPGAGRVACFGLPTAARVSHDMNHLRLVPVLAVPGLTVVGFTARRWRMRSALGDRAAARGWRMCGRWPRRASRAGRLQRRLFPLGDGPSRQTLAGFRRWYAGVPGRLRASGHTRGSPHGTCGF